MHTGPESPEQEWVTGILDESSWDKVLAAIIAFLRDRKVETVRVEFGFILERDLRGETVPQPSQVPVPELQAFIERGMREGTIVWGEGDFQFSPVGLPMDLMLCNDADFHFSSPDSTLLLDLAHRLMDCGVEIYKSGELVEREERG